MSSGELFDGSTPGQLLVVEGAMREAAVEDAHELVGRLPTSRPGVEGSRIVSVGPVQTYVITGEATASATREALKAETMAHASD